jgi:hypothetical protein
MAAWRLREPQALAIDARHSRLFVSCQKMHVVVLDAQSGRIVATLPTSGEALQTAFDEDDQLFFCPNGGGTMTIIHEDTPDKYSIAQIVNSAEGERIVAFDGMTKRVFLSHTIGKALDILVLEP